MHTKYSPTYRIYVQLNQLLYLLWKSATMSLLSEILEDPSNRMYVCFLYTIYSYEEIIAITLFNLNLFYRLLYKTHFISCNKLHAGKGKFSVPYVMNVERNV